MPRILLIALAFLALFAVFGAMVAVDRIFDAPGRNYGYVISVDLGRHKAATNLPRIDGPRDTSRPLVVIDAGHGGRDPGAKAMELQEKNLTLALALALRAELLDRGGIRVALTRGDDRFLPLGERAAVARRLGAGLFISIHADSTEQQIGASGATVYTLSDKGSNEEANLIAARENAVDQVNGVRIAQESPEVSAILVDLSQRDTLARSKELGALILREGQGRLKFREASGQSAAFAVLKAPDMPSVLFEAGYINNPADAARLSSPVGRQTASEVLGAAIRAFFARNPGR